MSEPRANLEQSSRLKSSEHLEHCTGIVGNGFASAEWLTVVLIMACSMALLLSAVFSSVLTLWLSVPALTLMMTLHSSLQHEVLHGHPTRLRWLNEALVFIPFGLLVPYRRFRDTHLQHHCDERLTDPHDDPESNYLDPATWSRLPTWAQKIFVCNNTLAGRIFFGPLIGMCFFYRNDFRLLRLGDKKIALSYLLHGIGLLPLIWWFSHFSTMPIWAYVLSSYAALSMLRVRTFLEHRADWKIRNRIVVIEDSGLFSWLFLNNNYHLVHHMHPGICWYRLPALFRAHRNDFLAENDGYYYPSYRNIFARYFLSAKDPVPHPLSTRGDWNSGRGAHSDSADSQSG